MQTTPTLDSSAAEFYEDVEVTIPNDDFLRIQKLAAKEGLPYQTFISSVLHKISTGQTVHFNQDDLK